MSKKESCVGVGIVGCGFVANMKHLPALSNISEAEIVAIFDVNQARAEEAGAKFAPDAVIHKTFDELISDNNVDTVYILTANSTHSEYAIKAMQAGKHVLCEKPMAMNLDEAERMLEISEKTKKKLTIGYQCRLIPEVVYLKQLCDKGTLGDIYYAKALAVRRRAVPTWGSFLDKEAQGGGCLIDMGTHAIDLALHLMNNYEVASVMGNTYNYLGKNPTDANAFGKWDPDKFEVEDSAFALIRMKNGATISVDCSWALNTLLVQENKTVLCGTKGGADMFDGVRLNGESDGVLTVTTPDIYKTSGASLKNFRNAPEIPTESRLWIDAIINDTEPFVKPYEAYTVSRIIEAIYESARTGQSVSL